MTDAAWVPEPRDVAAELDDEYEPHRFGWALVQDQLDHDTITRLRQIGALDASA